MSQVYQIISAFILHSVVDFTISGGNLLTTIPTFKKEYKISAIVKFNSFSTNTKEDSIFLFTLGGFFAQSGDVHPAVWLTSSRVGKTSELIVTLITHTISGHNGTECCGWGNWLPDLDPLHCEPEYRIHHSNLSEKD